MRNDAWRSEAESASKNCNISGGGFVVQTNGPLHTDKIAVSVHLATLEPSMNTPPQLDHDEIIRHISRDLADGYDEELEMEIEDRHPLPGVAPGADGEAEKSYRQTYFSQLFRLQAELVKLQDWVVASGQKVLILF
jgi:hypothetical protein